MKKINFNFYILGLVAVFGLTTSCTNNVDQNYPPVNAKPVGTLSVDNTSLLELDNPSTPVTDESIATCVLNMSQAYKTDMKYKVEFLASESTGTLDDFTVNLDASPIDFGSEGFLLVVPKNSNSASFTIAANFDIAIEQTETFKFRIYPVGDLNGAINPSTEFFTITIGNSISDSLRATFDWNGDSTYIGVDNASHSLSDYDFDLEIYDSSFSNVVGDSYSNSPEEIDFDTSNPDGIYYIVPSFWSSVGTTAPALPIVFNATVTVSKPGLFTHVFDLSGIWNSTTGGIQQGNPDGYDIMAYFIKTTNGSGEAIYELYDANDNSLLASGKLAGIKSLLGSKSKRNRK